MDELRQRREEFSENEKRIVGLHMKYLEERRKRFDAADTHLWIQQNQNETDLLFVADKLLEFMGQLKENSKNKTVFEDMVKSLYRIGSYVQVVEATSRAAVAEYIQERKTNERLSSEIKTKDIEIMQLKIQPGKMQKEIEKLRGQIEFHEKGK